MVKNQPIKKPNRLVIATFSVRLYIVLLFACLPIMYPINLNIILLLSQCIFATGLNELNPTTHREVAKYLNTVDTKALSSSCRLLNVLSRKYVLKKVKNSEHLNRILIDSSWKLVSSLRADVEEHFSDVSIYPITPFMIKMRPRLKI
jgi:hypothetical protein